ncbi:hypothetical protein MKEN_01322800 [Mycena kentingensis (nom. inval.)]|nr:hypothetical protein MKEN_01322800 [Mycena kentingensis (nom. inval.)]
MRRQAHKTRLCSRHILHPTSLPPGAPPPIMSSMNTPTTTHSLPRAHRLRLMRSMHKLEAVLGETPFVVDAAAPAVPPRPTSTITPSPRTSSLRRAATTKHSRLDASPVDQPLLVIDVPHLAAALPSSSSTDSMLSPVIGTGAAPPSPLTPTFALNVEAAARRRKLAKLVHTLGENVPPSLVFPATPTTAKSRRRASTLTSQVPEFVLEPRPHQRSRTRTKTSSPRTSIESYDADSSQEHLIPMPRSTHRQERGWSGEWSGPANLSMDEVVKGLRGLKTK